MEAGLGARAGRREDIAVADRDSEGETRRAGLDPCAGDDGQEHEDFNGHFEARARGHAVLGQVAR